MTGRHEYRLGLQPWRRPENLPLPGGVEIRAPAEADAECLAALMFDAYRGTIDFPEGATLADAREELDGFFSGAYSRPMLELSRGCLSGQRLIAVCLLGFWEKRDCPLVNFVMTSADWKRRGLARAALSTSIEALAAAGHAEVRAVVTPGNAASECLLTGLEFSLIK